MVDIKKIVPGTVLEITDYKSSTGVKNYVVECIDENQKNEIFEDTAKRLLDMLEDISKRPVDAEPDEEFVASVLNFLKGKPYREMGLVIDTLRRLNLVLPVVKAVNRKVDDSLEAITPNVYKNAKGTYLKNLRVISTEVLRRDKPPAKVASYARDIPVKAFLYNLAVANAGSIAIRISIPCSIAIRISTPA